MEIDTENETVSLMKKKLAYKGILLIFIGILIRILMLFYYYYAHILDPNRSWGDVDFNYYNYDSKIYPPLAVLLVIFFRLISFDSILIFAFWAFLLDLLTTLMFYFVIKSFNIKYKNYAFGMFLINPFIFLNNSFSLNNCGYHITDSFFFFFFFLALIFYPKKDLRSRYLFYIFLALSMVTKIYTIPAMGFLFLKFLYEKDWKEMKIFFISTIPIICAFFIPPLFLWDDYSMMVSFWNDLGEDVAPFYIRIIPALCIFILYILFRLKKAEIFEILFIAIIILASIVFFSVPFIRYFQPIVFFGILKEKEFFSIKLNLKIIKKEINVDNHLLTFYLSILAVLLSFLIIIFILNTPYL